MNDDPQAACIIPDSLEQVQQRFESRRKLRNKGTRIPQDLWQAAVSLSAHYSIGHLSKALRINYTALKEKVVKAGTPEKRTSDTSCSPFMELPVSAAPLRESTIEMIKNDGSVMRMQVSRATGLDLMQLAKTLWKADAGLPSCLTGQPVHQGGLGLSVNPHVPILFDHGRCCMTAPLIELSATELDELIARIKSRDLLEKDYQALEAMGAMGSTIIPARTKPRSPTARSSIKIRVRLA
ncbi:MAG: hypothetical protein HKP58_05810 [Desulfatitalea sp.]|nr:hypothetical protein [Desulfatitalea sp.]NNJ99910.1 hypothetical protein [Desulfatitalea sp.]